MALLEVNGIFKRFGKTEVLKGIDFSMEKGEVLAIIGSSGSGKTTLLRCLNFLETPDSGRIVLNGDEIYNAEAKYTDREIREKRLNFGLVFQSFNLFPQYTVLRNVCLAPEMMRINQSAEKLSRADKARIKSEIEDNARTILASVGLSEKLMNYPCELSGGQQQRVAIARALAMEPVILCFDEPTSALDPELTGEVLKKVSNGFFAKRDDYVDDGNVSVMGVAYIVNRMYSQWQDLPRTNGTDKDIEKFEVKYGDMLFCRSSLVAEGIGKASIVPEDVPQHTLFECHVIRLPLDLSKCVPEYMQVFSTMEYFRQQIIAQSKTATMTTIGQDGILKADILLPPMSKQREFYVFVHQVDKSKVAVQKALDETQILFDSLMQKYFG